MTALARPKPGDVAYFDGVRSQWTTAIASVAWGPNEAGWYYVHSRSGADLWVRWDGARWVVFRDE